ncbi:ABC transporter substrate-binding protein [Bacillus niameyensis]|uniref:ABC transporter substrate-binding protein n=1 Tax=Bacillus niameyensis TaxID=1522308 RepID=UPI0007837544|nr:ABC transporter substrate-binding protein [Bacillus niameyensis]
MRRALQVMFILMLPLFIIIGCSNSNNTAGEKTDNSNNPDESGEVEVYENGLPKNEKVTLKYGFFVGGYGREWVDYAIDTFTEKYPNVKIEITASPDISQILSTKISANNDKDMFDIFNREPSGGVVTLAEAGKLEEMDDFWGYSIPDASDNTVKDLMMNGLFESVNRVNGKSYEIPTSASVGGLFFNKNLFEEHGWNQNPKTWDEFVQLLEEIKSDGITPITFPGIHPSYHDWAFGDVKSFEIADKNGNAEQYMEEYQTYQNLVFTKPEDEERWEKIYELGKKGYFAEGLPALNHTQSQMQVLQADVAMVSTGSHVENEMKNSAPEDFEWGFMSVPFIDSTDQTLWVRQGTSNGHFIWAGKPDLNKKWAKEFILWMLTLDIQEKAAESGSLSVRNDFVNDPERFEKLQSSAKSVLDYIDKNNVQLARAYRSVSITHPSREQAFKVRDEAISNIFLGKQDPKPIFEKAEKLIQEALKDNEK